MTRRDGQVSPNRKMEPDLSSPHGRLTCLPHTLAFGSTSPLGRLLGRPWAERSGGAQEGEEERAVIAGCFTSPDFTPIGLGHGKVVIIIKKYEPLELCEFARFLPVPVGAWILQSCWFYSIYYS